MLLSFIITDLAGRGWTRLFAIVRDDGVCNTGTAAGWLGFLGGRTFERDGDSC